MSDKEKDLVYRFHDPNADPEVLRQILISALKWGRPSNEEPLNEAERKYIDKLVESMREPSSKC